MSTGASGRELRGAEEYPRRVKLAMPECAYCTRRAVGRVGPDRLCGRHLEEMIAAAPCPLSDCERRGAHAIHADADAACWQEPVVPDGAAKLLEHAHFFTYGECRAGQAVRAAEDLVRLRLAVPAMGNRIGVLHLTSLGHAVADLRARRRIRERSALLAAGTLPAAVRPAQGRLL